MKRVKYMIKIGVMPIIEVSKAEYEAYKYKIKGEFKYSEHFIQDVVFLEVVYETK